MADDNRPHPRNAPGPFYVVNGCCMACDVPVSEAPDLFTYDASNHCYVKRQPCTKDELDRTLRAAWAAELGCIRYRGNDAEVLRRFAEFGSQDLCDVPPPADIGPVVRDRVTFDTDFTDCIHLSAVALAESYHVYLLGLDCRREGLGVRFRYRVPPVKGDAKAASLTYSWFKAHWHTVEFRVVGSLASRWLVHHFSADRAGGQGVSNQLADWLRDAGTFCRVRWYSSEEWAAAGPGREVPL